MCRSDSIESILAVLKKKSLYVKTVKLLSLVVGPHTPSPTTSAMKENTWKSFYSSHKHDCADRHRTRRQRCSSVSCEPHTNMHKVPAETDFTDSRWVTIGPWRLSLHIQTSGADHVQSNPVVQAENKQGEGLQVVYLFFCVQYFQTPQSSHRHSGSCCYFIPVQYRPPVCWAGSEGKLLHHYIIYLQSHKTAKKKKRNKNHTIWTARAYFWMCKCP